MNRKQIIVLWIGIAIIVLMCLFPPFIDTKGGSYHDKCQIHYEFILKAPRYGTWPIDINRLIVQCAIVATITGGLLFTFTTKERNGNTWRRLNLKRGLHRIFLLLSPIGVIAGFLSFAILAEELEVVNWGAAESYGGSIRNHITGIFFSLIGAGLGFLGFYVVLRFCVYYFIKCAYFVIRCTYCVIRWLFSGFYDDVE